MIGGIVQQGDGLAIHDDETGQDLPLPALAITATFDRYAKPLAAAAPPPGEGALTFALPDGGQARLRAFRFRGWGDVEPSDYLLLERDGEEAVAGPAPLLVAALRHLARATRAT